jgi:hypothetical protein
VFFGHRSGLGHPFFPGGRAGSQGGAPPYRGWRSARGLAAGERGAILLETVIASMVFAMVGVAVLSGLDMVYAYGARVEVQATAENLVRNQFEDAFSQPFLPPLTPYPTSVGVPAGYTVSIASTDMPTPSPNIERLTVSVSHAGATVMSVETIRFNKP